MNGYRMGDSPEESFIRRLSPRAAQRIGQFNVLNEVIKFRDFAPPRVWTSLKKVELS